MLFFPFFAKASLTEWSRASAKQLLPTYQEFHKNPELSFLEEKTAERLAKEWRTVGLEVTTKVGGYGIVGVLKNGPGPTLLLRTDLDALPVEEKTGLEYASKKKMKNHEGTEYPVMHACGHDIHMTNTIGVANYFSTHRDEWKGTLVFIGEPAEEKGEGALALLNDGLLKRFPKPDYALALHVISHLETGKVGYIFGGAMASADSVDVTLRGKGGHGATPQMAIDPITMGAKFILDLHTLVTREFNAAEPVLISPGSFHCGTKHNVIPAECKIQLTVRSYSEKDRQHLFEGIKRKAQATAVSAGAPEPTIKVSQDGTPSLYNDPKMGARIVPALQKTLGEVAVLPIDKLMVSEDFSRYFLDGKVPTFMFYVGTVQQTRMEKMKKAEGGMVSLHSGTYYPDALESLATAQAALISAALEMLK